MCYVTPTTELHLSPTIKFSKIPKNFYLLICMCVHHGHSAQAEVRGQLAAVASFYRMVPGFTLILRPASWPTENPPRPKWLVCFWFVLTLFFYFVGVGHMTHENNFLVSPWNHTQGYLHPFLPIEPSHWIVTLI